nr:T9SS type A sorting domain-containing protein [Cyclobacteriaceae bacterium]
LENGDRVSSTPQILIRLFDNNSLLLKNDTVGILLFVTKPCSGNCVAQRIYFTNADVTWQPATSVTPFTITYTPELSELGQYTLQVTVADAKGNISGIDPYLINFMITDEAGVEIGEPYPMPAQKEITFKVVIKQELIDAETTLSVWDTTGRLVLRSNVPVNNIYTGTNYFTFDFEEKPGVYIYELKCQSTTKIGRLVLTP